MGGDGGVIPKNRRYLRGAGTSDKTGNVTTEKANLDPHVIKEERSRAMKFCAISNRPLPSNDQEGSIVICPYGKLYLKEAVVEALLGRKTSPDARLDHIRGLKDLHAVRFHRNEQSLPVCPVRGTELNGLIPAVVVVPGQEGVANVLSERARKEMGEAVILEEYGPAEQWIQLLPYGEELEAVQKKVAAAKKSGKKKKRKRDDSEKALPGSSNPEKASTGAITATSNASTSKDSAVLDSLFTKPAHLSEKDKADNLFARC